jgi:phosphoglycerol transferase MdoB-like AlkP superfamily enzyme
MAFESLQFLQEANIPLWLIIITAIWSLIWKGLALWKSSRKNSKPWFIALLVINTLGILEILYIYLFSEINLEKNKKTYKQKRKRGKR